MVELIAAWEPGTTSSVGTKHLTGTSTYALKADTSLLDQGTGRVRLAFGSNYERLLDQIRSR